MSLTMFLNNWHSVVIKGSMYCGGRIGQNQAGFNGFGTESTLNVKFYNLQTVKFSCATWGRGLYSDLTVP
jgi:hypothetical protein